MLDLLRQAAKGFSSCVSDRSSPKISLAKPLRVKQHQLDDVFNIFLLQCRFTSAGRHEDFPYRQFFRTAGTASSTASYFH
jgi:hypothetical protein